MTTQVMTAQRPVYFPGFNGLRFVAAFLVVIHHVEQLNQLHDLPHGWDLPCIRVLGSVAVSFFFVLSGFLITYLLLVEKEATGTIAVKWFYLRRMLRIWPLYFLITLSAMFLLPGISGLALPGTTEQAQVDLWPKLALFLGFLPNVALIAFPPVLYASHAWSIGVEEQFYLLWPVFLKHNGRVFVLMIGVIVGFIGIRLLCAHFQLVALLEFFALTRFDCMAMGGLGACLVHGRRRRILSLLHDPLTQIASYVALVTLLASGVSFRFLQFQGYSLLFAIVIVNVATNPNSLLRLESRSLDYLGRISYGIYMFHVIAIGASIHVLRDLLDVRFTSLGASAAHYGLTTLLTLAMAALSYHLFEARFLRLKPGYSRIRSGDEAAPRLGPEVPLPPFPAHARPSLTNWEADAARSPRSTPDRREGVRS